MVAQNGQEPKVITTAQAELTTVSVTIRALTLGPKQMTLAVFRQLPNVPYLHERTALPADGTPWGIVQYIWEGCFSSRLATQRSNTVHSHHLVWDNGTILHRSCLFPAPPQAFHSRSLDIHGFFREKVHELSREDEGHLYRLNSQAEQAECEASYHYLLTKYPQHLQTLADLRRTDATLRAAWTRAIEALMQLPQLFIAV